MIEQLKKTSEEITSNSVPDPSPLPDVPGPYLLIRAVDIKEKRGSVLLPESVSDDIKYLCNVGRILAVGPYAYKGKELTEGPWFTSGNPQVGEFVVYSRFAGQNFRYNGVNLKLVKDIDIKLRISDPKCIDSFANIERAT